MCTKESTARESAVKLSSQHAQRQVPPCGCPPPSLSLSHSVLSPLKKTKRQLHLSIRLHRLGEMAVMVGEDPFSTITVNKERKPSLVR